MLKTCLFISILFLFSPYGWAKQKNSESGWERIPVEKQLTVTDNDGNPLTINPSCAFDFLTNPEDGSEIDNSFHFYFKQGKKDKLVVFFNGGGACWDDATCVTSLVIGARPTYNSSIHQANSPLVRSGGIFDDNNKKNPFKKWSKVFIPYCTGDVHIGSNTVIYNDNDGSLTGNPGASIPIKHHGFDNFLAVREWIKEHFSAKKRKGRKKSKKLKQLVVAGSSAGGYGATFNFPYLQDAFPSIKAVLISDGAIGVLTQGFLDDVFNFGGNWNLESTLTTATFGENSLGAYSVDTFNAQLFSRLSDAYPKSRFAQYTTAFDFVQVQFLKIMTLIDGGSTNPSEWGLTGKTDPFFDSWNWQMELSLDDIADTKINHQFYIGEGTVHTILTDSFATESIPHPFYDEHSAEGIWFSDWIKRLVQGKKLKARNLKYSD